MVTFRGSWRLTSTARKPERQGARLRRQPFAGTCSTNGERQHWNRSPLLMAVTQFLLSPVHCAVDVNVPVSVPVTTSRKTPVFSNAAHCSRDHTYTILFCWLAVQPPKKERAREVLKNSDCFTALTSSNNQLLHFLRKEADHCVLRATEICLLLRFCLLLCTKKRFKMMFKHPLCTSSKLTKI